jgi:anaerobic selenocysteine-containing dehydrogenase
MFMLTDFSDNPDKYPLTAPSGKIEIFGETVAGFGLDGLPGHPVWQAPQEWLGAEAAKTYPLHLATHQPARRLHSQSGQSKFTRAGDVNGAPAPYTEHHRRWNPRQRGRRAKPRLQRTRQLHFCCKTQRQCAAGDGYDGHRDLARSGLG